MEFQIDRCANAERIDLNVAAVIDPKRILTTETQSLLLIDVGNKVTAAFSAQIDYLTIQYSNLVRSSASQPRRERNSK